MRYTSADGASRHEAVLTEQVRLLSRRRYDLFVNLAVSLVLAIALWPIYSLGERAWWLAIFWVVILARSLIRRRFQTETGPDRSKIRARVYTATTFATGALWAVTGTVVLVAPDPLYAVFTTFVLGGMMAAGIVNNAAYRPAIWAFVTPVALPTIVLLLTRSGSVLNEMGLLLAIFATVLTAAGIRINQTIVDSLVLRIEQESLVFELRARQASIAEAQTLAHVGGLEFDLANERISCTDEIYCIIEKDPATFEPSLLALLRIVHPDDRARLVARIADFTATGSHEGIDYRLVMDDGSIKFIRSTGRKVEGMSGKPPRYFASAQDVTEQEKAFEAIAYRDRLLDAVTTGTAILLAADSIDSGMPEALRTLGESMRLDHIDVFQEAPDLAATIALRYGWVAQDLAVPLHRSSLVGPPAGGSEMTQVRARLGAGEVVISQRGAGPLQALLERMHTQSLLLVPIVVDRQLWGNLGVDSSRVARRWSPIEVDTLKNFASIVGSLVVRNEARLSLEKSEQRFRVLSAAAPDAIVTMDGAGKIRQWNRAAERMLGYDERDAVGRPIHDFMVPERFKADAMRGLKRFLATGEGDALGMTREMGAVRKDGTEVTVEVSLAGVRVEDEWQAIGIIRDITVRKESENKVQFANVLLKTEIEASPDGILVVGPQREILLVNRRFAEMWGIASDLEAMTDEIALKASISGAKHPEAFALRVQYLYDHPDVIGDEEVDLVDGRTIDRRTAGLVTSDGHYLGRVWYFRDITARKNAESLAIRMAHYDVLTGLANRSLFVEALGHAIAEAKRGNDTFGVIYLDLDHFKDVNDTLGHAVGDELLKVVATRLHATVRAVDTAARFGGDEFAVVVSDVDEPAEVGLVADKILSALAQPYSVQGNDIRTSASIGIDLFGPQSADAEALLSHADVALYRAKSEGRGGYRFFTDAMDKEVRTRVTLGSELRTAVAGGQLFLMYQPQVEIESGRITGLEALVRWNHPTRGLLGPGVFIPVAESTGIVVALGQWVLITACRQTKAWLDAGIEPVRVSVNVSGLQFKTPNELEANVAAAFAETGLPAKLLELELTETVLMGVSLQQNESLTRLRQEGVTIAIDDFGTGYSSLGYLIRFPVDRIKIAQDFIRDVTTVPGQAAIAKATIGLAHDLGIDVIAEGVETREQLDALKGWGCPAIQGYYFAKPLSVDEVTLAFRNGGILKPRVPSPT